jgi:2-amino-4-hydroxy-6-hydroxymethyldihydropteridine diphosphokinase
MVADMDKRNNEIVLSLGGNIGEVRATFTKAIHLLKEELGGEVIISPLYGTKAWGVENQPDFLNQVVILKSSLSPVQVLKICLTIELKLGRVRRQKWDERVIDIDLLFYNNEIINLKELIVPHPYVHKRNFVLFPLVDVLPLFKHPLLGKTMEELKKECKDELEVIKYLA